MWVVWSQFTTDSQYINNTVVWKPLTTHWQPLLLPSSSYNINMMVFKWTLTHLKTGIWGNFSSLSSYKSSSPLYPAFAKHKLVQVTWKCECNFTEALRRNHIFLFSGTHHSLMTIRLESTRRSLLENWNSHGIWISMLSKLETTHLHDTSQECVCMYVCTMVIEGHWITPYHSNNCFSGWCLQVLHCGVNELPAANASVQVDLWSVMTCPANFESVTLPISRAGRCRNVQDYKPCLCKCVPVGVYSVSCHSWRGQTHTHTASPDNSVNPQLLIKTIYLLDFLYLHHFCLFHAVTQGCKIPSEDCQHRQCDR